MKYLTLIIVALSLNGCSGWQYNSPCTTTACFQMEMQALNFDAAYAQQQDEDSQRTVDQIYAIGSGPNPSYYGGINGDDDDE